MAMMLLGMMVVVENGRDLLASQNKGQAVTNAVGLSA
jgi:hypothetical protein